jgi:hypothetical protein
MAVDILGSITDTEVIATGRHIRELRRLTNQHGRGRWRKLKGVARVRLEDGSVRMAEVHWYEATGLGKKEMKIKRFLD